MRERMDRDTSASTAPARVPATEEAAARRGWSWAAFTAAAFAAGKQQAVLAALLAICLVLQYLLWFAEDGLRQTKALRVANQAQTEENAALNERNRALEADVLDLKKGLMAIEERARAEIGMVRHDETFYRILERPIPKPEEIPPLKAAAKPATTPRTAKPANTSTSAVKPAALTPSKPTTPTPAVKPPKPPANKPATPQ